MKRNVASEQSPRDSIAGLATIGVQRVLFVIELIRCAVARTWSHGFLKIFKFVDAQYVVFFAKSSVDRAYCTATWLSKNTFVLEGWLNFD